jgi:hypothetical protein
MPLQLDLGETERVAFANDRLLVGLILCASEKFPTFPHVAASVQRAYLRYGTILDKTSKLVLPHFQDGEKESLA